MSLLGEDTLLTRTKPSFNSILLRTPTLVTLPLIMAKKMKDQVVPPLLSLAVSPSLVPSVSLDICSWPRKAASQLSKPHKLEVECLPPNQQVLMLTCNLPRPLKFDRNDG